MTSSEHLQTSKPLHRGRIWFVLAACCTGLFALNVVSRLLFIKQGIAVWRVNDVGEFLLVLVAMAFFVAGLLIAEEHPD